MKTKPRLRLKGKKQQPKLPNPNGKGDFSLRILDLADHRFAVVKRLKSRIDQLLEESGSTTLAKEIIAARAAHIAAYLESMECDALDGTEIDYRLYFQATRTLTDVLNKLGLHSEVRSVEKLQDYLASDRHSKKRKAT